MTLLDHYLRAVRLYLPRGETRDDVLSELSDHLRATLEEREHALGRPLTDGEQETLLREHGDPAIVAARYGATNHGLAFGRQWIGPALFPWFVRLLLLQFGLTILVQLGIAPFTHAPIGILTFVVPMLAQFIGLTVLFSLIDLFQRRADRGKKPSRRQSWSFPPLYMQEIPRWRSAAALALFSVIGVWWVSFPHAPTLILLGAAGRLELTPAWATVYWPVLAVLALGAALRAATLAHPEWKRVQALGRLTTNVLLLIIMVIFLQSYPYAVPSAAASHDAGATDLALTVSSAIWWNVFVGLGLYWFLNVLFHVWFCWEYVREFARTSRGARLLATLVIVAAGVAVPAKSRLRAAQNTVSVASGADLYQRRCATCHDGGVPRAMPRTSLNQMSADAIRAALTAGVMRTQAAGLTAAELDRLVGFLAMPTRPSGRADASARPNACAPATAPSDPWAQPSWNGWGVDGTQRRFQPTAMAHLRARDVPTLTLKWAFGFPGASNAYAQPAIVGGRLFVGSATRRVYALDARAGCQYWTFDADAPVRTAITVSVSGAEWTAFFGDQHANLYAVDARTGTLRWRRRVEEHAAAVITGAPTLSGDTLYVPVSSSEEGSGSDPRYACCTFRGSVSAIDAVTGAVKWKTYTIPQSPVPTSLNAQGTQRYGPSGAGVWDSPTIDVHARRVYLTTGDSYSDPAADTSDAFLALDMDTGAIVWHKQMTTGDAFTIACDLPAPLNTACPKANGPDFDFGSSPMLVEFSNGRRALIAGQKSGFVHAVDPDHNGDILWQTRIGKGGRAGGVQWGAASDGARVYAALSDVATAPAAPGTAGAQSTFLGVPFLLDPKAGGGLFALDARTGATIWTTPHPGCGGEAGCSPAQSAAVTATPEVVFSGGMDGHLRGYAPATGAILWDVDTKREYVTVNGVAARGGSMDGPGPVVVDGMVYVNSGYAFVGGAPGNVLLAFSVNGK